jgi:hypothetical protein
MRKVMSADAKPEDGSLRGLAVRTPIAVPNYLAVIWNDLRELRIGLDRGYAQEPVWFAVQGVAASDVLTQRCSAASRQADHNHRPRHCGATVSSIILALCSDVDLPSDKVAINHIA